MSGPRPKQSRLAMTEASQKTIELSKTPGGLCGSWRGSCFLITWLRGSGARTLYIPSGVAISKSWAGPPAPSKAPHTLKSGILEKFLEGISRKTESSPEKFQRAKWNCTWMEVKVLPVGQAEANNSPLNSAHLSVPHRYVFELFINQVNY